MKQIYFSLASLLVPAFLNSGILNTPIAVPDKTSNERPDYKWMTGSYVGYAWSQNTGIVTPNPKQFNSPKIGDTDNDTVGNVPYAGFSLSRRFHKYYLVGFSYDVYGNFLYRRYHLDGNTPTPTPQAGVEVLGIPYSRTFNLDHQGVLFNLTLDLPKKCEYVIEEMHIKPVFGAGVGFGVSKVKGFQALGYYDTSPYSQVTTLGGLNVTKNFAWQCTLGLGFKPRNSAVSFGLAYRYYNGGKFESSNYFVLNDGVNDGKPVELTAWTGILKTQQLKMYINAEF